MYTRAHYPSHRIRVVRRWAIMEQLWDNWGGRCVLCVEGDGHLVHPGGAMMEGCWALAGQ